LYLLELYKNGVRTPIAVSKHFKYCYSFGKFIGEIAEPNQTYKLAMRQMKKEGLGVVWDRSKFEQQEKAITLITIREVKYLTK
jgi:hypothetical protein